MIRRTGEELKNNGLLRWEEVESDYLEENSSEIFEIEEIDGKCVIFDSNGYAVFKFHLDNTFSELFGGV